MSTPGQVMDVPRVRVSGHSVAGEIYPDLVDGRVENDSTGATSRQAVLANTRASRRSHSLLPENAAMVRRARINLSRRRRGFTAVVLGEVQSDTDDLAAAFGHDSPQPPINKFHTLVQRRASAHKLLTVTKSDPFMTQGKQCVSCIGHPDYCLTALGLHDECPLHNNLMKIAPTPRRAHSLRSHAYRMSANLSLKSAKGSLKVAIKTEEIAEENETTSGEAEAQRKTSASVAAVTAATSASAAAATATATASAALSQATVARKPEKVDPIRTDTKAIEKAKSTGARRGDKRHQDDKNTPLVTGDKEDERNLQDLMECLRRVSI